MGEDTQRNHRELCLLYENATANLELLKKSLWQVYVFYSAVVAVLISKGNGIFNEPLIKILICFLLLIGVIVVEFYTAQFRIDILKYRKILIGLHKAFGYPFREIRKRAKGEKKAELNHFEKVFRHGGCAYILVVFSLAIFTLWPEECKFIYIEKCKTTCAEKIFYANILLTAIAFFAIVLPLLMDKFVSYLYKKETTHGNSD
ncbi:MAG: hypothetical protein A2Z50_07815 [Nitrospirae bacterium RBG_19FT_COMBO_42_15]|nr:MAG: hypothetical protein A2Z50_07815 [Nitrospirae bacterium RBG_19FT_COMBO_42_15]